MANMTNLSNDRYFNPSADPTVKAGYEAIYKANADMMMTQIGQLELLFSLTGTPQGGDQSLAVQAALQHPFSQGRMWIKNNNPFDYPVIDPGYLTHRAGKHNARTRTSTIG
jgi:choline dehydrogenase